jgi:DNA-binding transcriptional MocR family regulator
MKKFKKHTTLRSESLIDQIADSLIEKIQQGEYPIDSRLPSVRKYAEYLQVSNETILRAYDKLVTLGYLEARRGSGFYVAKVQQDSTASSKKWVFNNPNIGLWQKILYQNDVSELDPKDIKLPVQQQLGVALLEDALQHFNPKRLANLSQYANPQGYVPLREQIQDKLNAQGLLAPTAQIISTQGSADALHLVIWSLFFPSQCILVEEPCSPLHIQRAMASGLEIVRVTRLDDGPDLEQLQHLCEKYKPKAFILSSILQNPTSSCLSIYKAHQLLRLADIYDFLLIDDDSYGDLLPNHQMIHITRLSHLDQLNRVIQIGSFSRTIAPGLRCGYIAAEASIIERIYLLYKSTGIIQSPLLSEYLMHTILQNHDYSAHCLKLSQQLEQLQQHALKQLRSIGWQIADNPAGIYLWGSIDAEQFSSAMQQAEELGYQTAAGRIFSYADVHESYARFSL